MAEVLTPDLCVIGAGSIGSLFAGHLARVVDVCVLTRREEHARALEEEGLRVTGRSGEFTVPTAGQCPGFVFHIGGSIEDDGCLIEQRVFAQAAHEFKTV